MAPIATKKKLDERFESKKSSTINSLNQHTPEKQRGKSSDALSKPLIERSSNQIHGNLRFAWKADIDDQVFTLEFSPNDDYLAVGLGTGQVNIYHVVSGELLNTLIPKKRDLQVPATTLRWRPHLLIHQMFSKSNTSESVVKNVIVVGYPDGNVIFWHISTGQDLYAINCQDNQIFSIDYAPVINSPDCLVNQMGVRFATAGSDCLIRIYRDCNVAPQLQYERNLVHGLRDSDSAGHTNRIFALRWHPKQSNILISGGWDSTIQVWDVDLGVSIRSMFGPHICGEALDWDESGSFIIVGSRGREDCLAIYQLDLGKRCQVIQWSLLEEKRQYSIFSCRSSSSGRFFVAGGGGAAPLSTFMDTSPSSNNVLSNLTPVGATFLVGLSGNEVKVFDYTSHKCVAMIIGLAGRIFSTVLSRDEKLLAFGGAYPVLNLDESLINVLEGQTPLSHPNAAIPVSIDAKATELPIMSPEHVERVIEQKVRERVAARLEAHHFKKGVESDNKEHLNSNDLLRKVDDLIEKISRVPVPQPNTDDACQKAEEQLISCLRNDPLPALHCWDQVNHFKQAYNEYRRKFLDQVIAQ